MFKKVNWRGMAFDLPAVVITHDNKQVSDNTTIGKSPLQLIAGLIAHKLVLGPLKHLLLLLSIGVSLGEITTFHPFPTNAYLV